MGGGVILETEDKEERVTEIHLREREGERERERERGFILETVETQRGQRTHPQSSNSLVAA